jgi:hypothetical protein
MRDRTVTARERVDGNPSADPFHERAPPPTAARMQLLGGDFDFVSGSPELRGIVDWAYAGLPRHALAHPAPRFTVQLTLAAAPRREPAPRLQMLAGGALLGAATAASDFVALSPGERSALIAVSRALLASRYHVRYELLEFAVFTLAARAQCLVPLHAACAGRQGRGLLLIGDSGAGKSTMALACALAGMQMLAEDSVFVTPDTLLATGVPNFLHVQRDTLRFVEGPTRAQLLRSPRIRRRSGVTKLEVDLRRHGFHLAPAPLALVASVFLSSQHAPDHALLAPLPRGQLPARLEVTQPYAAHQAGWRTFRQKLARLPAYELRRGSHPGEGVRALEELLGEHGRRSR